MGQCPLRAQAVTATIALPLRIGARTLGHVRRRLVRLSLSLDETRAGRLPALPPLAGGADGYLILSLPAASLGEVMASFASMKPFVRQRYRRSYASLEGSFEDYLASFSAKARSTLRRKHRKLAERSGGSLDLRRYSRPAEMDEFYRQARSVSSRSYQERLLASGLPQGDAFRTQLVQQAAHDQMRGWVLFLDGAPIAYLYAPADGPTLIYAYLGYDPDHASWSPGTVLQFEAMRQLIDEGRFRFFDFTEGEGQHKLLFGTDVIDCVDLLLVRRTARNLLAGALLQGFDAGVVLAKQAAGALRLERLARTFTR